MRSLFVSPHTRSTFLLWTASYWFVVQYALLYANGQTILDCTGKGACRCTFSDGSGVLDISSLGNQDGSARFPDAFSYDGKSYSFNPCFSFSTTGCSDAAVCEADSSGSYFRIGSQKDAQWTFTGFYPMLTYTNNDGKKTEISMICDQSFVSPQLDVFGEVTPNVVSMNLWSNCACPGTCKSVGPSGSSEGLTAGSVMLIIFFSVLAVYLIGGMAFNYHRQQGVSGAIIPNSSFWAGLPGLIKDGFAYTWAKIQRREPSGIYTSTTSST